MEVSDSIEDGGQLVKELHSDRSWTADDDDDQETKTEA